MPFGTPSPYSSYYTRSCPSSFLRSDSVRPQNRHRAALVWEGAGSPLVWPNNLLPSFRCRSGRGALHYGPVTLRILYHSNCHLFAPTKHSFLATSNHRSTHASTRRATIARGLEMLPFLDHPSWLPSTSTSNQDHFPPTCHHYSTYASPPYRLGRCSYGLEWGL